GDGSGPVPERGRYARPADSVVDHRAARADLRHRSGRGPPACAACPAFRARLAVQLDASVPECAIGGSPTASCASQTMTNVLYLTNNAGRASTTVATRGWIENLMPRGLR